ncbi:carbonic anhydrase [Vallitalea okinawensis]|uniref:carbonic anhydrase n=1 Tax=Vallitalea okinawensis TaxID=2078660 RepID=UPI000CFB7730|nr:carbonic anhydrase [Vallitalea okinawensis]
MNTLFQGVINFKNTSYKNHEQLYNQLNDHQNPHTLFITCSDSRIVPSIITDTIPGELFVIRNVANIIPTFDKIHENPSVGSAIEYATKVLNVENIVVCGHSNCGGCKAMTQDQDELIEVPITEKWIQMADFDSQTTKNCVDDHKQIELKNVLTQINHLLTYPFVSQRYKNKKLNIYGWYYDIGTGQIYNYNREKQIFELIQ